MAVLDLPQLFIPLCGDQSVSCSLEFTTRRFQNALKVSINFIAHGCVRWLPLNINQERYFGQLGRRAGILLYQSRRAALGLILFSVGKSLYVTTTAGVSLDLSNPLHEMVKYPFDKVVFCVCIRTMSLTGSGDRSPREWTVRLSVLTYADNFFRECFYDK